MDSASLGLDRGINPPGLSVRVGEMLAALSTVAGTRARGLVRSAPDPSVAAIVGGWPAGFTAERARRLGFSEQEPLVEIIEAFIAEDLAATRRERGM
jgi:hypothetical protein